MNLVTKSILALFCIILQGGNGKARQLPNKAVGMYLPLADDNVDGYHDNSDWTPLLYPYQQQGANVLFFAFINPATMGVPLAFRKLCKQRGSGEEGSVPADTVIIFAIGGYVYSKHPDPWTWLTSKEAAEHMARVVGHWKQQYGVDGIDLDVEAGAGEHPEAGINLYYFIKKLRSIHPDFIITQPSFGYPQIPANNFIINNSWDVDGNYKELADTVGIMAYGEENGDDLESLDYIKNFAEATSQWAGFPITVNVPRPSIMVGCKGSAGGENITTLATESVRQDLLGIMVWYCSVQNGFLYGPDFDCSSSDESQLAYIAAMELFSQHNMLSLNAKKITQINL